MTSIVDSREIVQAFDISGIQKCQIMHELIKNVDGKVLTLDAGFNDRKMYLDFYYNTIGWLKSYHQRSHTESFHSSFKRVFEIVTKVKFCSKFTQVCVRIIIHNFRRISYFEMSV